MGRPTWHQIQEQVNAGARIEDIELNVVYYGRVSTEKEYQIHSLETSNEYLEAYINAKKKWSYAGCYVDEGVTGTSADKRDDFLRMVRESADGKFSLIVTKEVSRFARNARECLNYIKILKDNHVGIYFINDNILTFRDSDNFSLNIRGVIAEEESRNTSKRVAFGHHQSIKKGIVFGNGRIYGYDKTPGGLSINEKEAPMIRQIFKMYAHQNMSLHQIELWLYEHGYRNREGRRISHVTLGSIVSNPKYKGFYVGNKVKIIDMQSRKQKFLDESEWIMYKDETGKLVPQIVDEETFDIAYARYKERKQKFSTIRSEHSRPTVGWGRSPLSGKIFCSNCGAPFWRDVVSFGNTSGREYWRCSMKKKNGAGTCPSAPIYLDELEILMADALREAKDMILSNAEAYAKNFAEKGASRSEEVAGKIAECQKQYTLLETKRDKLLEYNLDGKIPDSQFIERNQKFTEEMNAIKRAIADMEAQRNSAKKSARELERVCKQIIELFAEQSGDDLPIGTAALLVDSITVHPVDGNILPIDINLCTIPDSKRYLVDLSMRRNGNMVFTMLLERRMKFQRKGVKPITFLVRLAV